MDSEDEAMMDEEMDGVDDSDNMDDEDMSGEFDDNIGEDEDDDLPELEPVGSKGTNSKKEAKTSNNKSAPKKGSAVDDEFFKLSDLEKFLDDADVSHIRPCDRQDFSLLTYTYDYRNKAIISSTATTKTRMKKMKTTTKWRAIWCTAKTTDLATSKAVSL